MGRRQQRPRLQGQVEENGRNQHGGTTPDPATWKQEGTGLQSGRYNNCTGVPRFQDEEARARGAGVEDGAQRVTTAAPGSGASETERQTPDHGWRQTWPWMYNAGPGKPNDNISRQPETRIILLDSGTSSTRCRSQPAQTCRAQAPAPGAPAPTPTPDKKIKRRGSGEHPPDPTGSESNYATQRTPEDTR